MVVGAGAMGRLHARAIRRRATERGDCELVAVVDRHPARSRRVVDEFGGEARTSLPCGSNEADAAIVGVPASGHVDVARTLIARGLDLLVEKPLAPSAEGARELARLARTHERVLQVGHVEWYDPTWRAATARAGTVRRIEVDRLQPRADRGLDLDVVQDFMLHDLDWVSRWLGDAITHVEAAGRCVAHDRIDEAEVLLRFAAGAEARLRASRVAKERVRRIRIEGARATVEADLLTGALSARSDDDDAEDAGADPAARQHEPLDHQWADFLHACRTRAAPENDAAAGVAAVELVERVQRAISASTGGVAHADDPALGG